MALSSFFLLLICFIYYTSTFNFYFILYSSILSFIAFRFSKKKPKLLFLLIIVNILFFISSNSSDMLSFHEPQYLIFILCFVYFIFNYKNLIKIKTNENLIKIFFTFTLISYLYGLLDLVFNTKVL